MKITLIIISILFFSLVINAQSIIEISKFPANSNTEKPLLTTELLKELEWERIKEYCDTHEGHYARVNEDSLITEYEYIEQGSVPSFKIISFKGFVMQFNSEITNSTKPSEISYFDKKIWLQYVNDQLPNLEEKFKITIDKPKNILKAYYKLLGIDSRDEYGWICEYSTVGMATERRQAVIELRGQSDLLIRLLDYPNIQTQLYAADALIYDDYRDKQMIKTEKDKEFKKYLKSKLLSGKIWKRIFEIRDSNQKVKTCGNSGSYKIYTGNTKDLLSDKAISEIPKNYEFLKELGYFR